MQDRINALLEEISDLYVFGENTVQIEKELEALAATVRQIIDQSKHLIRTTQEEYTKEQDFVPSDIAQELTSLELLTERLQGAMEEKDKEFKRAKTVRTDYLSGVDIVQSWLQNAELRIQDRSAEPLEMKETLNKIHQEIAGIQDRLENVKQNGLVIIEKSRNDDEKVLIRTTVEQLTQQLDQLRSWLEDKKHQVGDSLDAWTRFMNLYQIVMSWAAEKKVFIAAPLNVVTLYEARQKMNEYSVGKHAEHPFFNGKTQHWMSFSYEIRCFSYGFILWKTSNTLISIILFSQNAVKTIKPIVKNLSEMDKELESITQVTTVGDLRSKLVEAEEVKVEVEAILLERVSLKRWRSSDTDNSHYLKNSNNNNKNRPQNALLQETTEEWEQCEKKLKDIRTWIEKTRNTLESPQHKKKPLRDQLGLCEKLIADISIQKTKITLSVEKLQVI